MSALPLPCNKVPYSSRREARTLLRAAAKRWGTSATVYVCRACGSWHIGHNASPVQRRVARWDAP
jgi:hypothetical protein